MKILYFGIHSRGVEYPRNNNLIHALRLNGAEVFEIHYELMSSFNKRINAVTKPLHTIKFLWGLLSSYIVLSWKFIKAPSVDVVIVGHPGYFHIHLAWLLCRLFKRDTMLVYDIFIPIHEALVEDRKLILRNSIAGKALYLFEKSCCRCSDLCLIDTEAHIKYMVETFKVPFCKLARIFVGATIARQSHTKYNATVTNKKRFNVLFVGTYIPLHGIDIILDAARYLQHDASIKFTLVGSGQLRDRFENLANEWKLTNVVFHNWVPTNNLGSFISGFDVALGIFGNTTKTDRVIPSKIFDLCAVGMPFITSDTLAIREVFSNGKNAYLIPPNDSKALASAIIDLKINKELRKCIAEGAMLIEKNVFNLYNIGNELLNKLLSLKNKHEFFIHYKQKC